MSKEKRSAGTFCMYYRELRHPSPNDIQLIDYASRIAESRLNGTEQRSYLDEPKSSFKKTKKSSPLVDAIPQMIVRAQSGGRAIYVNRGCFDYTG